MAFSEYSLEGILCRGVLNNTIRIWVSQQHAEIQIHGVSEKYTSLLQYLEQVTIDAIQLKRSMFSYEQSAVVPFRDSDLSSERLLRFMLLKLVVDVFDTTPASRVPGYIEIKQGYIGNTKAG
ncbi:hypothetical protein D3C85_1364790 [compost metagenome]